MPSFPAPAPAQPGAAETEPGLAVTYTLPGGDSSADHASADSVLLYVPAGQPPTPFMPGGRFGADFEGFISVDLRDTYTFRAELNGALQLQINDRVVLEVASDGQATEPTAGVRLNRGANTLKVRYTSPERGDAFLRLLWSSPDLSWEPIPPAALSRPAAHAGLEKADRLRRGRALFAEYQCVRCHQGPAPAEAMPELQMDAPSLVGIGARRNSEWLARWIADPQAQRPSARMPRVLHGPGAKKDAEDIAAYLASRRTGTTPQARASEPGPERIAAAEHLFHELHCAACHHPPDQPGADGSKISLSQVREKFAPGTLAAFLQKPDAHHAWIRMPDFKLTEEEAGDLAAWLDSLADPREPASPPADPATIQRGQRLVQTTGCLNCHGLNLENRFSTKPLADLAAPQWDQGCLADERDSHSRAPQFPLTAEERQALRAFAATDRGSLTRHVPAEFAARQVQRLNCLACHGAFDGFPPLSHLGGKLKPEWSRALLAGEVEYKPRPWIEARMPAFPRYAEALAHGLAMQHGYPPRTPPEPPIDREASEVGRRMIGTDGGFSCVACHKVGEFGAGQFVEVAAGINLAYSGERLLYPYYHRWMNDPLRIDPQTKMPVYFRHGRSLLVDYYDGDAVRQIRAMWEYLRLGPNMPSPIGAEPPDR